MVSHEVIDGVVYHHINTLDKDVWTKEELRGLIRNEVERIMIDMGCIANSGDNDEILEK